MNADCWFYWRNLVAAATKQLDEIVFFSKKNNCASRPMKRPALQEVQPPYFLLICTKTPAYWHLKPPIKWYYSICLVCLEWESAVPFVQKKLPKIPFKWNVSAHSFSKLGHPKFRKEIPENVCSIRSSVVQRLDNAIHRLNRYPVDKCWQNKPRYPLDSDLSGG